MFINSLSVRPRQFLKPVSNNNRNPELVPDDIFNFYHSGQIGLEPKEKPKPPKQPNSLPVCSYPTMSVRTLRVREFNLIIFKADFHSTHNTLLYLCFYGRT